MSVSRDRVMLFWVVGLALVILAPLGFRGYVLTYDMVWVPQLSIDRPDVWGLGSALPRAVPSDAWVAVLQSVIPAWLVQRSVLFLALVIGALGVARLVRELPLGAALVAPTFWMWNPFVYERLLIGHWPLLLGYAALPWVIDALRQGRVPWGRVILGCVALGLTPVGGLLAATTVLALARSRRHALAGLGIAVATSLPWIVSGLLHIGSARTDAAGAKVFALGSDGPMGPWLSALTLGGIWNPEVVPPSRTTWISIVLAVAVLTLAVVGGTRMIRRDRDLLMRLAALGLVGLVVVLVGRLAPAAMEVVVERIPGGGLLRDGTRWLALLAPGWAVTLAHGAAAVRERMAEAGPRTVALAMCVALPFAALPDLAWGMGGRLAPVEYPSTWEQVSRTVADSDVNGDLLVLPFSSYRAPGWNGRWPVLDPAGRYFPRATVVSDELVVGGQSILGEDRRAAAVDQALVAGDNERLRELGIGLILTDSSVAGEVPEVSGKVLVVAGDLTLRSIGDAEPQRRGSAARLTMTMIWILYGAVVVGGLVTTVRAPRRSND